MHRAVIEGGYVDVCTVGGYGHRHRASKSFDPVEVPFYEGQGSCRCVAREHNDRFRHEYNYERPHQALGQKQPADVYTPLLRPYPRKLPEIVYPRTYKIRKVCEGGNLRWCGDTLFIGRALAHEPLGFNEEDDGLWTVHFGPIVLGKLDERNKQLQFIPNKNGPKAKKASRKPTAL